MSSNFKPRSAKPRAIGSIIESSLRGLGISEDVKRYEAFPLWPELVGDSIARVSTPEKLVRGKILVVRVLDAVWAQELSLQKETLLQKVRSCGVGAYVEDIRFVTGDPKSISRKTAKAKPTA